MIILHVAYLNDDKCNGVNNVVPEYVKAQQKTETVGLLNTKNLKIENIDNMFTYKQFKRVKHLPKPFDKPDIIIFHQTYHIENVWLSKEAEKKRIPYIVVPHGDLTFEAQAKKQIKKKIANILIFNKYIKAASKIHYLSNREMIFSKEESCFVIGNGINLSNSYNQAIRKRNDPLKLTYIGRIDIEQKGLDLMLKAMSEVKEENIELNIYGPNAKEILGNLVNSLQLSNVKLHDKVINKEKENVLLNNTDIFIQTSRYEGLPMGLLEALSFKIPILITRETGLGELVEKYKAGWITPLDSGEIAKTIKKAYACKKKKFIKRKASARELIKENYIWEIITNKIIKEYEKVINKQ